MSLVRFDKSTNKSPNPYWIYSLVSDTVTYYATPVSLFYTVVSSIHCLQHYNHKDTYINVPRAEYFRHSLWVL